MTYKAKLVQQDRLGYNQFDIIKAALSSDIYQCKMGDIRIATHDHSANAFWQAQRLVITDETPYQDIKSGYVLCPDGVSVVNVIGYEADLKKYWCVVSGAKCLIDGSDYKKVIAAYPTIPDVPQIGLSDIRRWVDEGCKESVELEVTTQKEEHYEIYGENRDPRGEPEDYEGENDPYPRLTNNTVKMVWGEQDKAQPIAGDWADGIDNMKRPCYALFKHMSDNHNLTLLETELGDIVNVVNGMKPQQVAGADYENQYKLLQYEHSKLIERCAGLDAMVKVVEHHPATDWEALRDKFCKDAPLYGITKELAKRIADYFRNELTK